MAATTHDWMIYGATGYTGRLIAELAVERGHRPILAGRSREPCEALADKLSCPARVFSLDDVNHVAEQIDGTAAVLNCAGPFSQTAAPLIEACLMARASYLDITGEWEVIEHAARQHERAVAAGISLLPAVGFDVVPSDCLAARLAAAVPNATQLELAFAADSTPSPGTARTMLAQVGRGGRVRREGHIERVPEAWQVKMIDFPSGSREAVTIPWGDVASAWYSTGIANICVYTAMPKKLIAAQRRWRWLLPLARLAPLQWLGRRWIAQHMKGPTLEQRAAGRAEFWGRATPEHGRAAEATLVTAEGYSLTSQTALEMVRRTLQGEAPRGFSTPAKAFGADLIEMFPGTEFRWRMHP